MLQGGWQIPAAIKATRMDKRQGFTNRPHPLAPSRPGAGVPETVAVFCARTDGVEGPKQGGDLLLPGQGMLSEQSLSDKLRSKIAEIHRSSQACGDGASVRVAHTNRLPLCSLSCLADAARALGRVCRVANQPTRMTALPTVPPASRAA